MGVPEQLLAKADSLVEGVSAVKALSLANSQGIPIYQITGTNLNTVLPQLTLSASVKTDIVNAVNAGKVVVIPERELQVNDWRGVGYIVSDPATGAAGYLISGGLAGGSGTIKKILNEILGIIDRAFVRLGCLLEPANFEEIIGAITWILAVAGVFARVPIFFQVVGVIFVGFAILAITSVILQCISRTSYIKIRRQHDPFWVFT